MTRQKTDTELYREERDEFEAEAIRLRAIKAELVGVLGKMVEGRPTREPNHAVLGKNSIAYKNWLLWQEARAVLAKVRAATLPEDDAAPDELAALRLRGNGP